MENSSSNNSNSDFFNPPPPPPPPQTSNNPHLEKIRRETAILKKCNHPNVVKLKEVIDDPGAEKIYMGKIMEGEGRGGLKFLLLILTSYLVLEYLSGGEIKWHDDDPEVPNPVMMEADARPILRDVLCGIQYRKQKKMKLDMDKADWNSTLIFTPYFLSLSLSLSVHYQGIVHRDIKPANLLWTADHSKVKISDFGVSVFTGKRKRIKKPISIAAAREIQNKDSKSSPRSLSNPSSTSFLLKKGGATSAPATIKQHSKKKSLGREDDIIENSNSSSGLLSDSGDEGEEDEAALMVQARINEVELAKTAGSPAFFAPELCAVGDDDREMMLRAIGAFPSENNNHKGENGVDSSWTSTVQLALFPSPNDNNNNSIPPGNIITNSNTENSSFVNTKTTTSMNSSAMTTPGMGSSNSLLFSPDSMLSSDDASSLNSSLNAGCGAGSISALKQPDMSTIFESNEATSSLANPTSRITEELDQEEEFRLNASDTNFNANYINNNVKGHAVSNLVTVESPTPDSAEKLDIPSPLPLPEAQEGRVNTTQQQQQQRLSSLFSKNGSIVGGFSFGNSVDNNSVTLSPNALSTASNSLIFSSPPISPLPLTSASEYQTTSPGNHNSIVSSPETLPIGFAIDIWALGVTLYCFIYGRVPFIADTEFELFSVICKNP